MSRKRPYHLGLHAFLVQWALSTSSCSCDGPTAHAADASTDAGERFLDAGGLDAHAVGTDVADAAAMDASLWDASSEPPFPPEDASDENPLDGGATSDAGVDAGDTIVPPPNGTIVVDACVGESGVDESCVLVTNGSACTEEKCSKLVVVFSGGEMGCVTGEGYGQVLSGYASHGYAALCINYFETLTGSGYAPYVDEAQRIDIAMRAATTGPWAQAYWTGEDLLIEGISHGATAPVILMARTGLELADHWQGSHFTAGCFFDGIYDPISTANLLDSPEWECRVLYNRMLRRYCGVGATRSSCDLTTVAKVEEDNIVDVLPLRFGVQHFRMFECGSALESCLEDAVAAEPIEALCQNIDASPLRSCDYIRLPMDSHMTCHADHYDMCRAWFEGLLPE